MRKHKEVDQETKKLLTGMIMLSFGRDSEDQTDRHKPNEAADKKNNQAQIQTEEKHCNSHYT